MSELNEPEMRTGIMRRTDDLGRVVIPREIRQRMGISDGTCIEQVVTPEGILMRPVYTIDMVKPLLNILRNVMYDASHQFSKADYDDIEQTITDLETKIRDCDQYRQRDGRTRNG